MQKPTSIRTYANQFEAEAARDTLEAAGIEASLPSDDTSGFVPGSFATGGVRLYVAQADVDRAIQVLQGERAREQQSDDTVDELAQIAWHRYVLPILILGGGAIFSLLFEEVPWAGRIIAAVVAVLIAVLVWPHDGGRLA